MPAKWFNTAELNCQTLIRSQPGVRTYLSVLKSSVWNLWHPNGTSGWQKKKQLYKHDHCPVHYNHAKKKRFIHVKIKIKNHTFAECWPIDLAVCRTSVFFFCFFFYGEKNWLRNFVTLNDSQRRDVDNIIITIGTRRFFAIFSRPVSRPNTRAIDRHRFFVFETTFYVRCAISSRPLASQENRTSLQ